jgi:rhodanese-related sulfurtransferase
MNANQLLRALAFVATALGIGAAIAGSPKPNGNVVDVDALARAVVREDDHVTAIELARWIRERRRTLRIIDVRSKKEYDEYHVPTAERIPVDSLTRARFEPGETIVLYSEGGAHAAQGWVFLRAIGQEKVFFLRGGLNEWLEDVMNPTVNAVPTGADTVVSELSKYFGGVPRVGERNPVDVAKMRRRGC